MIAISIASSGFDDSRIISKIRHSRSDMVYPFYPGAEDMYLRIMDYSILFCHFLLKFREILHFQCR